MELVPKGIEAVLPLLYSQENVADPVGVDDRIKPPDSVESFGGSDNSPTNRRVGFW